MFVESVFAREHRAAVARKYNPEMYLSDVPCEALLVKLPVARFPQACNAFLIWTVNPVSLTEVSRNVLTTD
jgi:hypothetical protein